MSDNEKLLLDGADNINNLKKSSAKPGEFINLVIIGDPSSFVI